MDRTLLTLNNEEAKEVAQYIVTDIADQMSVIQDCMVVEEEENYIFIDVLKQIIESGNEEARELLSFLLGIGSQDLDLHIQGIIEEILNCEE